MIMGHQRLNLAVAICVLLFVACTEQRETQQILPPNTIEGSIRGNISPISVYDAKVEVLQEGKVIATVGVQDGVFHIKNLPPGHYNLRVSAFAYVTNDAIRGIEVIAGQITEVGRAVIFPQDTGEYIPTRIMGTVYDAVTSAPIAGVVIKRSNITRASAIRSKAPPIPKGGLRLPSGQTSPQLLPLQSRATNLVMPKLSVFRRENRLPSHSS